jgi:indolepyruvate ferredoxin oxidoreductase beta subunit
VRDDIILCGVGGQGTVLASRLLSNAALRAKVPVKAAETIGMAQRGGSVTSHVRIGKGPQSPLVPDGCATALIAFEPAEAARSLHFLKKDGCAIVANRPLVPTGSFTGGPAYQLDEIMDYLNHEVDRLVVVDVEKAAQVLGSAKPINVLLLGAAIRAKALSVTAEQIEESVRACVRERFLEMNLRALALDCARQ